MKRTFLAFAGVLALAILSGCSGPRVVFLPSADAPVRAGPGMSGRVYVWTGGAWELSRNSVTVPEGFYIWDAGDAAPTNTVKGK
ncbi:MAG: hypothetical protein WCR06_03210 [bacterium]